MRTYVRAPDGRDGLWFVSLEAGSVTTVVGASSLYGVPHHFADMAVDEADVVRYRSRRREKPEIAHDITVGSGVCASRRPSWTTG